MNHNSPETLSIIVERELHHSPEKIWRALTEPHLIEEWLMKGDFEPAMGHRFSLRADWGKVDCEVRAIEPGRRLSYTWDTKDLRSIVTWTISPSDKGTRVRMEQTGFRPEQRSYYQGAQAGWPRFLDAMERVVSSLN